MSFLHLAKMLTKKLWEGQFFIPIGTVSSQSNDDQSSQIIINHRGDWNASISKSHNATYNDTQPIDPSPNEDQQSAVEMSRSTS